MYLTESERKRIKALYEASSASDAGSYEIPMGFKADRPEMVGELPDEMDMGISDDEGISIDVDELMGMLGMSEEDDKDRMRQLHNDNSVIKEQGKKYLVIGDKFCLMGSCGLNVKVVSVETSENIEAWGVDGKKTVEELYKELEDMLSKDNKWKGFNVELPELKDFEDSAK